MDLDDKGDWHVEANGGTIPLLETPDGNFIKDSQAIIGFCE